MILETDAQYTRQAERLAVFGPVRFSQEQNPLSVMLAARSGYPGIFQSRDQACGFAELTVDVRGERRSQWPGLGIRTIDGGGPGTSDKKWSRLAIRKTGGGRPGRRGGHG